MKRPNPLPPWSIKTRTDLQRRRPPTTEELAERHEQRQETTRFSQRKDDAESQ